VEKSLRAARESMAESRRVVWALLPGPLSGGDLPEALRRLSVRIGEETGADAELVITGAVRALSPNAQTALLRVVQEALSTPAPGTFPVTGLGPRVDAPLRGAGRISQASPLVTYSPTSGGRRAACSPPGPHPDHHGISLLRHPTS
jgi:hypothetical protein